MRLLETQLARKIWLGNFWKNFLRCSVVGFPHGNIQAQWTGKGRTTDSAVQFLKYAYTLSHFSIKAQMYQKLNIPESIYHSCSFHKRVNSGFRPCLRDSQLSGLAELCTWLLNEKLPSLRKSFPLLKLSVALSNPCAYAANFPALTWTCTLSASGQSCSKSMALLLAGTLIHWCRAIKCWWPLIALSKLPSYSLSSTCQLPALKWML